MCVSVPRGWRRLMTPSTLTYLKPHLHLSSCCFFFFFLLLCFFISGATIKHSCGKVLPRSILWTPPANLLAFFHQPGDTVLVAFRPASLRATTHLSRRHAKSPCQLDMTHGMPQTHHCDNPVIINTHLSASAQGAKVLRSWTNGEGRREKERQTH